MCFYVNGSHVCCVSLNTYLVMARDGCFICTLVHFIFLFPQVIGAIVCVQCNLPNCCTRGFTVLISNYLCFRKLEFQITNTCAFRTSSLFGFMWWYRE